MKPARFTYSIVRKETLSCGGLLFLGLASHGNTAVVRHVRWVSPALRPISSCPLRLDASPCRRPDARFRRFRLVGQSPRQSSDRAM